MSENLSIIDNLAKANEDKGISSPQDLSFDKFVAVQNGVDLRIAIVDYLCELKSSEILEWHTMEHKLFNFLIEAFQPSAHSGGSVTDE